MLIAIADSSFLSIPEANEILVVLLSIGEHWGKMLYYVLMSSLGSLIGCTILYFAARKGGEVFLRKKLLDRKIKWIDKLDQKNGFVMVFVSSLLPPPTPFKLFVISAAISGLSLQRFTCAVFIGRSLRYLIWGVLAVLYGVSVREFVEKRLHAIGLIILGVLLLSFVLFLIIRFNRKKTLATD